eukprot:scaffold125559_cov37-Prasinocladus_malaysianus.AAC.1
MTTLRRPCQPVATGSTCSPACRSPPRSFRQFPFSRSAGPPIKRSPSPLGKPGPRLGCRWMPASGTWARRDPLEVPRVTGRSRGHESDSQVQLGSLRHHKPRRESIYLLTSAISRDYTME